MDENEPTDVVHGVEERSRFLKLLDRHKTDLGPREAEREEGIKVQAIENVVKTLARRAGLGGVSPQTLRHIFGKSVIDSGVDLTTVAGLTGHDSIEMTAIHTRLAERDMERTVERLASAGDRASS